MRVWRGTLVGALVLLGFGCSKSPGESNPIESLSVEPNGASIDDSTTLGMRAAGVRASGQVAALDAVDWSVEGPATIDSAGVLTPSGTGSVTVTATSDGLVGQATITVLAPGTLDVRVVDAESGAGISGAIVRVTGETDVTAGSDGSATVSGGFSGAVNVTVWATGYHPMTVVGAQVKNLVLPLRPIAGEAPGEFNGKILFENAFGSPDPPAGELYLGFASAALSTNILNFNFEDLLGDNRTLSLAGTTVDAPSNIYVYTLTDDYIAKAPPGQNAVFALGGSVKLETILDIADNVDGLSFGQIIQQLIPVFSEFQFAVRTDLNVTSGGVVDNFHLDLSMPMSDGVTVNVPTLPVSDPSPLVVAARDLGDLGLIPIGFGVVENGGASLKVAPGQGDLANGSPLFAVVARDGGIDSSSPLVYGALIRGVSDYKGVEIPAFFDAQSEASYSSVLSVPGTPGTLTFPQVSGADFSFVTVVTTDPNTQVESQWDVAISNDTGNVAWPFLDTETGVPADVLLAGGSWTVQAVGMATHTFQSVLTDGNGLDLTSYADDGNRIVVYDGDL